VKKNKSPAGFLRRGRFRTVPRDHLAGGEVAAAGSTGVDVFGGEVGAGCVVALAGDVATGGEFPAGGAVVLAGDGTEAGAVAAAGAGGEAAFGGEVTTGCAAVPPGDVATAGAEAVEAGTASVIDSVTTIGES